MARTKFIKFCRNNDVYTKRVTMRPDCSIDKQEQEQEHVHDSYHSSPEAHVLLLLANSPGDSFFSQLDQFFSPKEQLCLAQVCRSWHWVLVCGRRHCFMFRDRRTTIRWRVMLHEPVMRNEHAMQTRRHPLVRLKRAPGVLPQWLGGLKTLEVTGDFLAPISSDQITGWMIGMPELPALETLVLDVTGFEHMDLDLRHLPALHRLGFRTVQGHGTNDPKSVQLTLNGCPELRHLAVLVHGDMMLRRSDMLSLRTARQAPLGLQSLALFVCSFVSDSDSVMLARDVIHELCGPEATCPDVHVVLKQEPPNSEVLPSAKLHNLPAKLTGHCLSTAVLTDFLLEM